MGQSEDIDNKIQKESYYKEEKTDINFGDEIKNTTEISLTCNKQKTINCDEGIIELYSMNHEKLLVLSRKGNIKIYNKELELIHEFKEKNKNYSNIKILDKNNFLTLVENNNKKELIKISLDKNIKSETLLEFKEGQDFTDIIYYKDNILIIYSDNCQKGFSFVEIYSNKKYQIISTYKHNFYRTHGKHNLYLLKNSDILMQSTSIGDEVIFWDLKKGKIYYKLDFFCYEFFCEIDELKIIFAEQVCAYTAGDEPPSDIHFYDIKNKELIKSISTINSWNPLIFEKISYLPEKEYILISFLERNEYHLQIYDKELKQKLFSFHNKEAFLNDNFIYFYHDNEKLNDIIISYDQHHFGNSDFYLFSLNNNTNKIN